VFHKKIYKTAVSWKFIIASKRTAFSLAILGAAFATVMPLHVRAAGLWQMYQNGPDHNAVLSRPPVAARWVAQTAGKINGGLAIVDNIVFAASFDHRLYAFDVTDGGLKWSSDLGAVSMTTPIVDDGIVIVGTGDKHVLYDTPRSVVWGYERGDDLLAFNASTGALLWKYHTLGEDMPSAAIINPLSAYPAVAFANGDGHARVLDLHTGKSLWDSYLNGVTTMSSMAFSGDVLFGVQNFSVGFIFANKNHPERLRYATWTWALRASDGQMLWRAPYGNSDCSPTVADGKVFVASDMLAHSIDSGDTTSYSNIYALDASTGKLLWHFASAPGTRDSIGTNENAIAGMYHAGTYYSALPFSRQFAAFDATSGHIRWVVSTKHPVKMSAVLSDGHLFFGDTGGTLYVVNAADGHIVSTTAFPSIFTSSSPVVVGQTLYIANDTRIYATPLDDIVRGVFSPR
jgi:outer membrane protein assembly factor BamB